MGLGGISPVVSSLVVGQAETVTRSPLDVFNTVFTVFVVLGTLVGIVVIAYTLKHAWTYRDDGEEPDEEEDAKKKVVRPTLGELPTGSGGGKKLFVSFGISAVIVLSLIVWTYSALLYVNDTPDQYQEDALTIDVVGERFAWNFIYPNGHESTTLRIPKDRAIELNVTSSDVFHNIGIPEFKVKTDAIPGQTTSAWFSADRTGEFEAICYELCGSGHSAMRSDVIVMERQEFQEWYESTGEESTQASLDSEAGDA